MESHDACSERGYRGLLWLMQQREKNILAVCHGGLLNYTMNHHSKVVLADKRDEHDRQERRCITKRFGNCEIREFRMAVWDAGLFPTDEKDPLWKQQNDEKGRPSIIMEEVTMDVKKMHGLTANDSVHEVENVHTMT